MRGCRLLCGLLAAVLLGGCTRQPVGAGDGGPEDAWPGDRNALLDRDAPPPRDLTPPADFLPPPDTAPTPADSGVPPADFGPDTGYFPWYCPPGVKSCLTNNDCPEGYYCITGCCKLTIG